VIRSLIFMIALGSLTGPLRAQSADMREEVATFQDSLRKLATPGEVGRLATRDSHRSVVDPMLRRLRYAWALVELGQRTDSAGPLIRAADEFWEVAVRHRDWPDPWFGLGAAKSGLDALGAREHRSQHQTAGNGWRQGAIIAFMEALRADPDFRPAAIEAAKLSLRDENIAIRPGLAEAIQRAVMSDSADALGWFLLGRFRRRLDRDSAAAVAYGRAFGLGGRTYGVAALELARELIWIGQPDSGRTIYYAGATAEEPDAIAAYRKDLAPIATETDLKEWDGLAASARPAWLLAFWGAREAASGRPAGTRLPTHERRWRTAYEQFRLIPAWTHQYQWGMPYRSGNDELDDRGTIYIRHGDPDRLIDHFGGAGEESAQTWVYERPDGDLIFHFKLSNPGPHEAAVSGWRAVESIATIDNSHVLPDLIGVDPIYTSLYLATLGGSRQNDPGSQMWARERQLVRASIARGTTTDSDPLRFARKLAPIVQAYGVGGGRAGSGQVLVVWAISGRDHPRTDTLPGVAGVFYGIRERLYLTDTVDRPIATLDTVIRVHAPAPLRPGQFLSGTFTLEVPAGRYRAQLVIADSVGEQGALRSIVGIPVPAFTGSFEISDLVLGLEGQGLVWNRAGTRFPLNPRNAWTSSEAVEIGFELAGLPPGQSYKVRIALADLGADSTTPPKASVEFENQASGARELVTQSLSLRGVRPGRYLLTTTITADGKAIRRERRITVAAAQ
jgi:GWxTD domain-containing protein